MAFISTETAINGLVPLESPVLPPDPYSVTIISPGGNDYEYMRRYTTLNDPSDILDLVVRRLYVTDYEIIGGAVDGSNLLAGIGTYSSIRLQVYGSEYVSESVYIGGFYGGSACPVDTENLALYAGGDAVVASNLSVDGDLCVVGDSIITGISTIGLSTVATAPENVQLSFELASNTSLRIRVRGTDGVLRSATIALS